MNIYLPEPVAILVGVLSFLAGFLYRKYHDHETIVDAYDEGFEKGARSVIKAVSELTGKDFKIEFGAPDDEED